MTTQIYRRRSLFWPLILIGVGVVWLLTNLGILQPASIQVLFRLWPLIFIIVGLDLLFGRNNPRMGTMIGLGGVALIVALMLVGPVLGLSRGADVKTATYSEPVGDATSATVNLNLSVADTTVTGLSDSNQLIDADLRYIGDIDFNVSGEADKTVTLSNNNNSNSFSFWDFGLFNGAEDLRWDVGLSKDVPIALDISGGVGRTTLELGDVKLSDLKISGGVGEVNVTMPSMESPYNASLKIGTGASNIRIQEGAAVTFTIEGGVGSVTIDVPEGSAVRVEASTGVGSVNLPSSYNPLSGSSDKVVGEAGVWETDGFDGSTRQIVINFKGGVGSLTVR